MSLVLADGTYSLKRRRDTTDESRTPVPSYPEQADWAGPGYAEQKPDRSYAIGLDAASWPLAYGDLVVLPGGTEVVVRTANLVPSDPDPLWDEVRGVNVTGVLRSLAHLDREEQGG